MKRILLSTFALAMLCGVPHLVSQTTRSSGGEQVPSMPSTEEVDELLNKTTGYVDQYKATGHAQSDRRVSLQLGTVTVWLGMDRVEVKRRVETFGMYFPKQPNPEKIVVVADLKEETSYALMFRDEKLSYATRNWPYDKSNSLPTVMDALASLVDEGATKCIIEHAPLSSPGTKMDRVFINCGERGLLLSYGTINGLTDKSITETIGNN
jgi:hypothetical protein